MGEAGLTGNLLDKATVVANWNLIAKALEPALEHSLYDLQAIYDMILEDHAVVWMVTEDYTINGYAVTIMRDWPKGRVFTILLLAGSQIERWFPLWSHFEDYAKNYGCDMMTITGRPGWDRVLKSQGFNSKQVVMTRTLGSTH